MIILLIVIVLVLLLGGGGFFGYQAGWWSRNPTVPGWSWSTWYTPGGQPPGTPATQNVVQTPGPPGYPEVGSPISPPLNPR